MHNKIFQNQKYGFNGKRLTIVTNFVSSMIHVTLLRSAEDIEKIYFVVKSLKF